MITTFAYNYEFNQVRDSKTDSATFYTLTKNYTQIFINYFLLNTSIITNLVSFIAFVYLNKYFYPITFTLLEKGIFTEILMRLIT